MPEPSESKMQIGTGDRGGDEYRVAPELKKGGYRKSTTADAGVPTRDMLYFAADNFYQFDDGKDGFLPDGVSTDGSQPRHMMPEDNKGIFRGK